MRAGSPLWFARHEMRLAWRDAAALLGAGRRGLWSIVAAVVFLTVMHLVAYAMLSPSAAMLAHPDKATLVTLTGSALLAWLLLVSQAMETVTRGFYARDDLDLILSSPAPARRLLAVRLAAQALSMVGMAAFLVGPFVDVATALGGPRFLAGYGVLVAMAAAALAVASGLTAGLFRLVGPKRTRLLAQIFAAVIGAGFVVGIQVSAISSSGTLSRSSVLRSPAWVAAAPGLDSPAWLPARAAMGDIAALALVLAVALGLLAAAVAVTSRDFERNAAAVASAPTRAARDAGRVSAFRLRSQTQTLRRKEWLLLWRDPWLVSQSLMQVLYLLPPAFLLWHDYGSAAEGLVVVAPVLVMAAGQLAGGLAWLAISGEDAPDLVATAPIDPAAVLRAKVEAVMLAVAVPVLPIVAGLAFVSPRLAAITIAGIAMASSCASAIQFVFRSQAKRSTFRRRHTSSRVATFAEAFASISVAGAAGLAGAGEWLAAGLPLFVALAVVAASARLARREPGVSARRRPVFRWRRRAAG